VVSALKGQKAVVAKLGMDAHWRGAIVVANALTDAGMEVVYLGHASPEEIVQTVVQEDAILLGLSSLSGNHMSECPPVLEGLRRAGVEDTALVLGGTVHPADRDRLHDMGFHAVFGTGTLLKHILGSLETLVAAQRLKRET
jgi:methylmalonyl-CoA mutase, C-terminal domain